MKFPTLRAPTICTRPCDILLVFVVVWQRFYFPRRGGFISDMQPLVMRWYQSLRCFWWLQTVARITSTNHVAVKFYWWKNSGLLLGTWYEYISTNNSINHSAEKKICWPTSGRLDQRISTQLSEGHSGQTNDPINANMLARVRIEFCIHRGGDRSMPLKIMDHIFCWQVVRTEKSPNTLGSRKIKCCNVFGNVHQRPLSATVH